MLRSSRVVLVLVALLLAGCATAAPTASPTPAPTPAPTAAPTAASTTAPTATPTAAPTQAPTLPPTAAPTATGEPAFPNQHEALLVSYVLPEFQDSCVRYPPTYDTELASIQCGPEDLPVDYTLFGSLADMAAAYNRDLRLGDPPQPDGSCDQANYEAAYPNDGAPVGRVNCRQHTSSSTGSLYHDIEWTNDELLVLAYISNLADLRSWDELIEFWREKSGPFAP